MSARREPSGLRGVLLVDKPAGMTSHDVVAHVRRAAGERRVGHAGTLDPSATGLLVVLVGPYTRLEPFLSAADKRYTATITFGAETDTDDADGAVTERRTVPDDVLDPGFATSALRSLVGARDRMPPAYSAIKIDGQAAHRVARAGGQPALSPRPMVVHEARLLGVDPETCSWDVEFCVSKGTYIRSLARDLGRECGTCAHLSKLTRTASGPASLSRAHRLSELADRESVRAAFVDPVEVAGLESVTAPPDAVAHGRPFRSPGLTTAENEPVAVLVDGELAAVYRSGDPLTPLAVFPPATAGG